MVRAAGASSASWPGRVAVPVAAAGKWADGPYEAHPPSHFSGLAVPMAQRPAVGLVILSMGGV